MSRGLQRILKSHNTKIASDNCFNLYWKSFQVEDEVILTKETTISVGMVLVLQPGKQV
jgi:hypothetical protein